MRTFCATLFTVFMITPTFAYTDEPVAACTPDAMRLCSDAIPDQGRITKVYDPKEEANQLGLHAGFQAGALVLSRCG